MHKTLHFLLENSKKYVEEPTPPSWRLFSQLAVWTTLQHRR